MPPPPGPRRDDAPVPPPPPDARRARPRTGPTAEYIHASHRPNRVRYHTYLPSLPSRQLGKFSGSGRSLTCVHIKRDRLARQPTRSSPCRSPTSSTESTSTACPEPSTTSAPTQRWPGFKFRARNQWIGGGHNRTTIEEFYGAGQEDTTEGDADLHGFLGLDETSAPATSKSESRSRPPATSTTISSPSSPASPATRPSGTSSATPSPSRSTSSAAEAVHPTSAPGG
jgi:hypothetical protein